MFCGVETADYFNAYAGTACNECGVNRPVHMTFSWTVTVVREVYLRERESNACARQLKRLIIGSYLQFLSTRRVSSAMVTWLGSTS